MQVIKLTFQDGHEQKMDAETAVTPGTYEKHEVPDPVGMRIAQFFKRGRREEIMRDHGRIKEIEVRQYQPLTVE